MVRIVDVGVSRNENCSIIRLPDSLSDFINMIYFSLFDRQYSNYLENSTAFIGIWYFIRNSNCYRNRNNMMNL